MKTLIHFELKKIFTGKRAVILFSLLALLCIGFFALDCYNHHSLSRLDNIKKDTQLYVGEIQPSIVEAIRDEHEKITSDPKNWVEINGEKTLKENALGKLVGFEYILSMSQLNDYRHNYALDLEKKQSLASSIKETLIIQDELNRFHAAPNLSIGYNLFFDYFARFLSNFAILVLGFSVVFLLSPLFNMEYTTGMDALILSSKHGKRKLIYAKLLSGLLSIVLVHFTIFCVYCLLCAAFFGVKGGNTSFVAMFYDPFQYLLSPYGLSMNGFFVRAIFLSLCAAIGIGGFTILLSTKIRQPVLCMSIALAVFFVPLLLSTMGGGSQLQNALNFSYGKIMQVTPLYTRYRGFVIFGKVITEKALSLFLLGATTLCYIVLSYKSFRKRQVDN
ncbi:ABC transporter permease [Clostridiaceae bacterium OttesenSCG-928-D20]|nr:ABC transporter permease [Clostridiaceae bacterium OttesenSCG-928-D20]